MVKDPDARARRERHARELEVAQGELRASIAQSMELADQAEAMIRRHKEESDGAEELHGSPE